MRVVWLLVLLLAAPIVAAQASEPTGPTLQLEPEVMDVRPSAQPQARAVFTNPLARDLVFDLSVSASEGVKTRIDRPQVRVPAGSSAVVHVTMLVPNATNVTHVLELEANEVVSEREASAARGIVLTGRLEVRVRDNAPPPPVLARDVVVDILTNELNVPSGESAMLIVHVRNNGRAPIPGELVVRLPAGLRATQDPPPSPIGRGVDVTFALHVEDDGTRAIGSTGEGYVGLAVPGSPGEGFTVRTVAPWATEPALTTDLLVRSAVALSVAVGSWTALWLTRRHWWPLLLALYTRLRPTSILDHPVRRRIAEIVQAQPGIPFGELARAAGVAAGQLTHHARMLEKAGVVFSSPDGQTRRFFHVGSGRPPVVPPLSQRALDLLRERPRRASDLAKELGVSRQALHYHTRQLVAEGKLVARVDGRELWFAAAAESSSAPSRVARA